MTFQPKFDAVIFDLDGVITKTALVHAASWKRMFDEYMRSREERFGEAFREFTHAGDYLPYVDGKPRYKGVQSFLESRGIDIPIGDPSDEPDMETVCGLGNKKNIMFNKVLEDEGVEVYESSVEMLEGLKAAGVRIGVASSSKNCKAVLETAGLLHYFETRVDGVVSAEIGLQGKPEPDIFTTACDNLGVEYHRSVVVEDAVSGVMAGHKGNFGLTLGLAREDNIRELLAGGADIVVEDLDEIGLEGINKWFERGMEEDAWLLKYHDYSQEKERSREALLAVGNGYFGTRGALEESSANQVNYPGTYMTGLFNRLTSKVGERDIENEDFVNASNWLPVTFRIDGGPWLEFKPEPTFSIIEMHRTLDMRSGGLHKEMVVEDQEGRLTRVHSSRFAGMADPHRAGLRYTLCPLNYEGTIEIRSGLHGDHRNSGVERYNSLEQKHLEAVSEGSSGRIVELLVKTTQSDILIAMCASFTLNREAEEKILSGAGRIDKHFSLDVKKDQEVVLDKMLSIFTSRDPEVEDPLEEARDTLEAMSGYQEEMKLSEGRWKELWNRMDVVIRGDREAQKLVRLHLFHMMVSASPHHAGLDSGIPPRGLHGEAYRGHIFWDELYILPLFNLHFPEVVKSVLMYRYRRLDAARAYAREYGYEGAMFPWQSGSDGREETQIIHLNPLSGEWGDDYSSLQRHISLAIAYNIWNYYQVTGDREFMEQYGAEILLDICKFWVSKSEPGQDGRFHIHQVMGPDEFHETLPGSGVGGLTDNAYTNIMVSWMIEKAFRMLEEIDPLQKDRILDELAITGEKLERWEKIMHGVALHISNDGVVEQFKGYFGLEELDWEHYRRKYGDIHRLDRILKSEGKSPDDYKLAKQADFLMSFYNLGTAGVKETLAGLGYTVPEHFARRNFEYYIARTSHGSTLSRLVHARLAWEMGMADTGWELFMDALRSDLVDIQGGTTGEGVHCGVMAGTVYDVLVSYAGLDLRGDTPVLHPKLPAHWKGLDFHFTFRGTAFLVSIIGQQIKISGKNMGKEQIKFHICGEECTLSEGNAASATLK
ncbi:MAG: beta-phosphoglucomutase family hydrolase [Bacteroidales bacterium]|nr:beta-phosphoglucomutase family hydrolase [Bacteroidales bacterium]